LKLHFSLARSAVTAKGVTLEVIHRYKYQRALWFEPFLADLLLRAALPVLGADQWDLVVPVPLHPTKEREREFNQAERIGAHLARALKVPLRNDLVRRVLPTRTQTLLTKNQRAENVRRAFAAGPGGKLKGARVILLDDVLTTGATTSACARVLRSAGAGEVCVWTVARTNRSKVHTNPSNLLPRHSACHCCGIADHLCFEGKLRRSGEVPLGPLRLRVVSLAVLHAVSLPNSARLLMEVGRAICSQEPHHAAGR
jgi:ComF family protein